MIRNLRKKAKSGAKQAVVATARKLGAIYYKMVTDKVEFNPSHIVKNTEKYLKNKLNQIEKMKVRTEMTLLNYQNGI